MGETWGKQTTWKSSREHVDNIKTDFQDLLASQELSMDLIT